MYELDFGDYARARPLFAGMEHHLAVEAIFAGTAPGKVYIDHPRRPGTALAWTGHRFYLAGGPSNQRAVTSLRSLLEDEAIPLGERSRRPVFVVYYAGGWEEQVPQVLRARPPMKAARQFFQLAESREDWRALVPAGFAMQAVNRELLQREGLAHLAALREEMCSERPSVNDFLARSFGLCLLDGAQIAGWCLSEYNTGQRCEVGIEMVESYRRRGLGTALALAFIEEALARGMPGVGWHSFANNMPSVATALRAGFAKVSDYSVYFAWYGEGENQAVNGNVCLGRGEYREALVWFERAIAHAGAKAWAYWGAGCAAARLGQAETALGYLAQAVERGLPDRERLLSSDHLRTLHGTPGWQALLARPVPGEG